MLVLSLGLVACNGVTEVLPTPSSVGVAATATSAPSASTTTATTTNTTTANQTTAAATTTAVPATTVASQTISNNTTNGASRTAQPATTVARTATPTGPSRIAYVEGNSLYVIDVVSRTKKLLVQGGTQEVTGSPAWSPDNKRIAVTMKNKTSNQTALFGVNPETGEAKPLLSDQTARLNDREPVWSPDGSTIAFTRQSAAETGRLGNEVWLVDADGKNARKLANGLQPAWSPEGLRIAFVTNGVLKSDLRVPQDNAIHLINAKGQNEWEPMTTAKVPSDLSKFNFPFNGAAFYLQYPVFLEGGKTLGFTTLGGVGLALTINSSTGGDLKLWGGQVEGGYGRTFAQPKNGNLFMYEGLPPTGLQTFEIVDVSKAPAPDKVPLQRFGGPGKGEALYPAWSPDGSQLAYVIKAESLNSSTSSTLMITKIGASGASETTDLIKGNITGLDWSN